MLLAIDVGNSNMTLGFFRGKRLVAQGRLKTWSSAAQLSRLLKQMFSSGRTSASKIEGVILSSVVPQVVPGLTRALKKAFKVTPQVLGRGIAAPIQNRYRIPSQVGQDRLCNAAAAYALYGGPVIVVDFGTAVTLDLVSAGRAYLGGLIVPGMEMALEALTQQAALLPQVSLKPPRSFLGRDTAGSIRSGIFFGYSALCDGIIQRLKTGKFQQAHVVATGGNAKLIAPYCKLVHTVNPALTLEGLRITFETGSSTPSKRLRSSKVRKKG